MLATIATVVPIFALVLSGWLVRRIGVLGAAATTELNRFVVYLALPALLFDVVAKADLSEIWQPGFIAAFGLGSATVFAGTLLVRLHRGLADATIEGLNAAYANTGFLGFPLALAVLGRDALGSTLVATIITACILFAVAIVLIEIGVQKERQGWSLFARVGRSLITNPLLLAPALAAVFPLTGMVLPTPVASFFDLLEGAASPCALVALGLFLAAERQPGTTSIRLTGALLLLKLIGQPVVTWILAVPVFHLPPSLATTAVLLAALPTGTGPFMLAEFYGRQAAVTSRIILLSTLVSVLTVSAYLTAAG
jgi:malonate transporter